MPFISNLNGHFLLTLSKVLYIFFINTNPKYLSFTTFNKSAVISLTTFPIDKTLPN